MQLAAHADVVGVEREKWTLGQFTGVEKNGYATTDRSCMGQTPTNPFQAAAIESSEKARRRTSHAVASEIPRAIAVPRSTTPRT